MECVERGQEKVLPVLYKVEPNDVRNMLGKFGDAFRPRKHRFDKEVKRQGKEALKKAPKSRVFEPQKFVDGREGELVNKLVETITSEMQHELPPSLPVDLVRIDDCVAEVMKLANTAPSETRIIGIHGMGGIGKTTLATIIYKKLFDKFKCRYFLKATRETIKSRGMEHVQSLLISNITKSFARTVHDSDAGIEIIRSSCKEKKVLILLDDVDRQGHLDKLIGHCSFGSGSRIIVTCRDKALLKHEHEKYELKEMNRKDSLLLFSRYEFEGDQPPTNLVALFSDIVATTGGLPLALVIIGSYLKRKDKNIWIETQDKLKKMFDTEVQEKLKKSYDALKDNEKQMFLDIACFFIRTDKRIATYLWKDLQLYPDFGLARMIKLSLIKYDEENKLRMHDQLRDLGRAIAHPEGTQPWDCRRLWDEEAMKVLPCKINNNGPEIRICNGPFVLGLQESVVLSANSRVSSVVLHLPLQHNLTQSQLHSLSSSRTSSVLQLGPSPTKKGLLWQIHLAVYPFRSPRTPEITPSVASSQKALSTLTLKVRGFGETQTFVD